MGKNITTKTTIQNLAEELKKKFSSYDTNIASAKSLAESAFHGADISNSKINFYKDAAKTGPALASIDLPADMVLDLTKTELVESFEWSDDTYPGSDDPNLEGKPVLVMAVKGAGEDVSYSFLSMEKLIDTYTAAAGDGTTTVTINGYQISVNVNISDKSDNILKKDESGKLYVPKPEEADISGKADKDTDATEGNIAVFDGEGNPVDGEIKADDLLTAADISDYSAEEIQELLGTKE